MGGTAAGAVGLTLLAACGDSTAPASPTAAPAAAPTAAPKAAAPTISARRRADLSSRRAAAPTTAPAAGASGAAAAASGTLRFASADFSSESLDPNVVGSNWIQGLMDTLLTYDPQGNIVPNLAESYELSPDGLTWTFKIRRGITFHNGDPLTAADVAFSIQRFGSKESNNPWSPYLLRNNESITVRDDDTVVYKALKPEWPLKVPFAETRICPRPTTKELARMGSARRPSAPDRTSTSSGCPRRAWSSRPTTTTGGRSSRRGPRSWRRWSRKSRRASRSWSGVRPT